MEKVKRFLTALQKRVRSKLFWTSLGSAAVLFLQLMGHQEWAQKIPMWVDFVIAFGTFAGIFASYEGRE